MQDKRRHKRYSLDEVDINGKLILADKVEIIDISVGGIALKADRRLNIGGEYLITLGGKGKGIKVKGTVVRSALSGIEERADGERAPVYTAGLLFKDDAADTIADFLKSVELSRSGELPVEIDQRLNVRFNINTQGDVILDFPSHYSVKNISLSGMLIETGQWLEIDSQIGMTLSIGEFEPVSFVGRVASCVLTSKEGGECFKTGIEFVELTEKDKQALETFIRHCAGSCEKSDDPASDDEVVDADYTVSREFKDDVEYLHSWHQNMGYYKVLGIEDYASQDRIDEAYSSMAKKFHPDMHPKAPFDLRQKINDIFVYINNAYSTLSDPEKRKQYDQTITTRMRI